MNSFVIKTLTGKKYIGPGHPVFIIAEMSGNHNQNIQRAYKIIDAAVKAGVDAIKLQTYTPDTITIDSDEKYFQVKVNKDWKGQTLYNLYKKAYTPWEWQPKLKKYAESKGLICFSTPFDSTAVDFLEKLGMQLYKVASFEIVDSPLLERIGKTKKPVIMSRGMATEEEIRLAIRTLKRYGCPAIALLHCVSSYPTQPDQMNLATIPDIAKMFNIVPGLSDHTLGTVVSVASIPLGARIIEKHLTLKRSDGGPDATFSLESHELKELVQSIRTVELAIGKPHYGADPKESENIVFRKLLFVVKNIKAGERFTPKNVRVIRPGYGLAPKYINKIIDKKSAKNIKRGTPLSWDLVV